MGDLVEPVGPFGATNAPAANDNEDMDEDQIRATVAAHSSALQLGVESLLDSTRKVRCWARSSQISAAPRLFLATASELAQNIICEVSKNCSQVPHGVESFCSIPAGTPAIQIFRVHPNDREDICLLLALLRRYSATASEAGQ